MFFKLIRGYSAEDFISIDESELEKAQYCFLMKKDSIYSGGPVKGSEILAIQPDYHKTMGWNRGYKLEALDYAELAEKGLEKKAQLQLQACKERVLHLIKTNQEPLIGTNLRLT